MEEAGVEFPAPGLGLTQPQFLQASGECTSGWKLSVCQFHSDSQTLNDNEKIKINL